MDWGAAIERHRDALLRLLAVLSAAAGLGVATTLKRHVYGNVLSVLRPAESAARRLVVIAARGLCVSPRPARPALQRGRKRARKAGARLRAFPLFDARKTFGGDGRPHGRRAAAGIWVIGAGDRPAMAAPQLCLPEDPLDAAPLRRRMQELHNVLDDLPKYARRLARAMARRALAPPGPGRVGPLRPGLPPGQRRKPGRRVDEILARCHDHARYALRPPDTS